MIPLGVQPILDFTVEGTHCYESGGVIHHNTSKSLSLAYAVCCWLTGEYPGWWTGRRFSGRTDIWIAGQTGKLVRDSLQQFLIGTREKPEIGMLRGDQLQQGGGR